MVLGVDGEVLVLWIVGESARHRPGFEDAFHLEAKVVVEIASFVAVDDERARAALGRGIGRRLGSALEVPLLAVGVD
jgi:hypothetical protein